MLLFRLIYQIAENKLAILKEYINKNLKRGFIKELTLRARALVLFVFKKDSKLQLVVNYYKLNNVTIKDKYSILLLVKLNNRLSKAKFFTKLNQKGGYNYICIKEGKK